jgi:hypothetical protein
MAVVELWYQGLRASWLPRDYSAVCIETPSGVLMGIGAGDGSMVVATERLTMSVTLSSDHPPREGGPLWDGVATAWARLCIAAWAHHRAAVAPTTSEGRG